MYLIKIKNLDEKIGLKSMEELSGFIIAFGLSKLIIEEIKYYE